MRLLQKRSLKARDLLVVLNLMEKILSILKWISIICFWIWFNWLANWYYLNALRRMEKKKELSQRKSCFLENKKSYPATTIFPIWWKRSLLFYKAKAQLKPKKRKKKKNKKTLFWKKISHPRLKRKRKKKKPSRKLWQRTCPKRKKGSALQI